VLHPIAASAKRQLGSAPNGGAFNLPGGRVWVRVRIPGFRSAIN
jgi:hypothetical protein